MRASETFLSSIGQQPEPIRVDKSSSERALGRFDDLKPSDCCLTSRDYDLLERHWFDLKSGADSYAILLSRMIQQKLAEARVVLPDDVAHDVVTGNSRVVFAIDGRPEECRRLVHWRREFVLGQTLLVPTPLGVTLLGLSAGQRASLPRGDGTSRQVQLREVAYQPEHERRSASQSDQQAGMAR